MAKNSCRTDILRPSLKAAPPPLSSHWSCKPIDEYPYCTEGAIQLYMWGWSWCPAANRATSLVAFCWYKYKCEWSLCIYCSRIITYSCCGVVRAMGVTCDGICVNMRLYIVAYTYVCMYLSMMRMWRLHLRICVYCIHTYHVNTCIYIARIQLWTSPHIYRL